MRKNLLKCEKNQKSIKKSLNSDEFGSIFKKKANASKIESIEISEDEEDILP